MCGCKYHWDSGARCTCQCPDHAAARAEDARYRDKNGVNPDADDIGTDVALIRRAAALMRERAEAATFTASPWGVDEVGAVWAQESDGQSIPISTRSTDADAEHIASMHPAVALAVADLLDLMAEDYAPYWMEPYAAPFVPVIERAYAVVRAYLGASA